MPCAAMAHARAEFEFMFARMCAAVLIALVPLAGFAQQPSAPAPEPAKEASKVYIPGIEQFMNVIQSEHAKLWYAASARNWQLAAYQLGEIKEIMSDVEDLYPTFKNLPLGKMLDNVITGPIAELEKALDAKDFGKFSTGYGKLTDACNACHQATGMGFIVIQRPANAGFPNQDFRPHK
jgi:mono/diheme cytochrome c family protein